MDRTRGTVCVRGAGGHSAPGRDAICGLMTRTTAFLLTVPGIRNVNFIPVGETERVHEWDGSVSGWASERPRPPALRHVREYQETYRRFDPFAAAPLAHERLVLADASQLASRQGYLRSTFGGWQHSIVPHAPPTVLYLRDGGHLLAGVAALLDRRRWQLDRDDPRLVMLRRLHPLLEHAYASLATLLPEVEREDILVTSRLTVREIEIARLAATGYRNAEIAATLMLSEHTVKRHLANIYAKLDIDSRIKLARLFGPDTQCRAARSLPRAR